MAPQKEDDELTFTQMLGGVAGWLKAILISGTIGAVICALLIVIIPQSLTLLAGGAGLEAAASKACNDYANALLLMFKTGTFNPKVGGSAVLGFILGFLTHLALREEKII